MCLWYFLACVIQWSTNTYAHVIYLGPEELFLANWIIVGFDNRISNWLLILHFARAILMWPRAMCFEGLIPWSWMFIACCSESWDKKLQVLLALSIQLLLYPYRLIHIVVSLNSLLIVVIGTKSVGTFLDFVSSLYFSIGTPVMELTDSLLYYLRFFML